MNWISILILAIAVIIIKFWNPKKPQKLETLPETEPQRTNYANSYQRKYLLTKNEYREYMQLREIANRNNLIICPKVRLLDIIEPRKGESEYQKLLNKIQSKHIDFVICDKDLRVKAILELDDNSHNQRDRQERDAFVDQILTSVGYKVIHTRSITETTLEDIAAPTNNENPE